MARYTVESPEGKRITFEWDGEGEPSQDQLAEIFKAAGSVPETPKEATAPKSVAVQAADLVRPELSSEYPTLSAAGNVAADLFGGVTGMGDNLIKMATGIPEAIAHPIDTAKAIGRGVSENPLTATSALMPFAKGAAIPVGMAAQAIDQARNNDHRPLADRFADVLTAGAANASKQAGERVAVTKPAQAASAAAKKATDTAKALPGLGRVVRGVTEVPEKVKGKIRTFAEERAVAALNPTKKEARNIAATNPNLGRTLLDEKAVPVIGTPERIKTRVEAAKEAAGERVGEVIGGAHEKLTAEVPATPYLKPMRDPLRGPLAPVFSPDRRTPSLFKADDIPAFKPSGKVIDANRIASSLKSDVEALRKVPGMESSAASIDRMLDTLRKNEKMTLPEAQKLRQEIDASINWNKRVPEMARAQEFLYQIRSSISNKMNDVIGKLEGVDALKNANRKYSDLAAADTVLEKNIPRGQSNQVFSLGDKVMAGAGGAIGGAPGALVAAGGNKVMRTIGDAAAARTADAVAKRGVGTLSPLGRVLRAGYVFDPDQRDYVMAR